MNNFRLLLLIALLISKLGFSQTDKEFWFVAPEVSGTHADRPIWIRMSTTNIAATVTIDQPANPGFTPIVVNIPANTTTSVDLTTWIDQIENGQPAANTTENKGLHLSSTQNITAYYEVLGTVGPNVLNSDIFVLKGKNALGTRFYTPFQNLLGNADNIYCLPNCMSGNSAFDIVATTNSTSVTITPTQNIVGHSAGIPFTIVLNKGQTYSAQAIGRNPGDHLSGSLITSDQPIAVTIKDDSARQNYALDLIGDQLVPVNVVGTDYIVVRGSLRDTNELSLIGDANYNPNLGDRAVICATENNTTVSINGVVLATLNAGQIFNHQIPRFSTAEYILTSHPAYVFHVSGFGDEVGGALLPPIICTGSRQVSVFRDTPEPFYLNILVRNGGQNNFTITNSSTGATIPISSLEFTAVPGTPLAGDWFSAHILYNTTNFPSASSGFISNSSTDFHLGIINGQKVDAGCRYGYFSNYAGLQGGNAAAASSTICYNTPTSIVLTGSSGNIQWQQSPDGSTSWTDIPGAINATYTTPNLTTTNYYRAVLWNGSCANQFSTNATVFVDPLSVGGIISSNATVCYGANAGTLTLSGYTGNIIRWESSVNNWINVTSIPNTAPTLAYLNLTVSTKYRAVLKSGTCSSANSAEAIITVDPLSLGGSISNNATFCSGINSGSLTLAGYTGSISQWESSIDNFATFSVIANTSNTYTYNNVAITTSFRAIVKSGTCSSATSSVAIITIGSATVAGNVSKDSTFCSSINSGILTLSGYTGNIMQWESSTDNFTTPPLIINNTLNIQTYTNISKTTQYRVQVQSPGCTAEYSSIATITITEPATGGIITSNATVCEGNNSGTLILSGYTGSITGWESSIDHFITPISIANTGTTQNYNNITQTTEYRALLLSAKSCPSVYSALATITVNPPSAGGTLSSDATVCSGTNSGILTLSGDTGSILRWESSIDNFVTHDTILNTGNTYTYSNITQSRSYRAVVQSGSCSLAFSGLATISVDNSAGGGSVSSDATVCSGSNSGILTVSGYNGNILRWESSIDNFVTYDTIVNNGTTQSYTDLTKARSYRVVLGSGSCSGSYSGVATIKVDSQTVGGTISQDDDFCSGINSGILSLSGNTGSILKWESSTDDFANNTILNNTGNTQVFTNINKTTKFRAVVKSGSCAIANSSLVTITIHSPFSINLGNDTLMCFAKNQEWKGTVADTFKTVLWSNGSQKSTTIITNTGNVWITLSNQYSCTASDTIHIGEYCKKPQLCFPDVITPNGDGFNDNFVPCSDGKLITDSIYPDVIGSISFIDFEVFNRWGIKLFESQAVLPHWDATFQGSSVPSGTYYWIVKYTDVSKEIFEQSGYVTVINHQ
jgi:gliding motility-associated-like protein